MSWLTRLFKSKRQGDSAVPANLYFTNTLSGKKEIFIPLRAGIATLYTCGPTVYDRAHIGNLRSYVFSDTIARTLSGAGYRVKRVINITDVGHMVGDGDSGEDKIAAGAKREKTTPTEIADRYTKLFISDISDLGIDTSDITFPRASNYIKEQIALAMTLEEKGFAYRLADGLYFDTQKFGSYGALGGLSGARLVAGSRVEVILGKRHASDFVLWRCAKPDDLQQWDSPWGAGNPGWHIECSAMIRALLGQEIDIHTGGEDHISIHHNNEIAQSEAASGRTFVHYWMHNAFVTMSGEKISKSLGNVVSLTDLVAKGVHPLALRYFFLQAHYRTPLSFSYEALAGASEALSRMWKLARDIARESKRVSRPSTVRTHFVAMLRDDLATPKALSIIWDTLKSEEYSPEEKWGLLEDADAHLGLSLANPPADTPLLDSDISPEIRDLLARRSAARASKDFKDADRIRVEIENRGYRVDDGPTGAVLTRTTL